MHRNPLYFIALMPPSEIRQEIRLIKEGIKARYQVSHALKLPAHITMQIPFRMHPGLETNLCERLHHFCLTHTSWNTVLQGFGRFKKQVIFIIVEPHEPFVILFNELQQLMLSLLELKNHEISGKIHPHITVATRDLKRSHFPEIWDEFSEKEFSHSFKVCELHLFKHNGRTWDTLKEFKLSENC